MKIGVMSDSHESVVMIKKAVEFFNSQKVESVIHAGDIISPIMVAYFKDLNMEFVGVFGNNDGEKNLWQKRLKEFKNPAKFYERFAEIDFDGKKFLVIHEPYLLDAYIASRKYDYIIYGHTHKIDLRKIEKTIVLNPGEICGYLTEMSTAAVVDTKNTSVSVVDLTSGKTIEYLR